MREISEWAKDREIVINELEEERQQIQAMLDSIQPVPQELRYEPIQHVVPQGAGGPAQEVLEQQVPTTPPIAPPEDAPTEMGDEEYEPSMIDEIKTLEKEMKAEEQLEAAIPQTPTEAPQEQNPEETAKAKAEDEAAQAQ